MTLKIIIGQDVGAYATISAPDNTDLSRDNLKKIAHSALGSEAFQPEFNTVHDLRIVGVYDEAGKALIQDVNLEENTEPCKQAYWLQIIEGRDISPVLDGPFTDRNTVLTQAKEYRRNVDPNASDDLYCLMLDDQGKLHVGAFSGDELEDNNDE